MPNNVLDALNNNVFLLTKSDLKVLLMDLSANRKYLTAGEAAEYLRVTERYLRALMKQKKVPFYKLEGKVLFKISELDSMLEKYKKESLDEIIQKATNRGR
ncbi:MAG: helix-turn-helix domain-containing protein [Deltaproteobacteria bacterium]|jgi:excisionase family DNA binding protein|nr:helix-turn-helix domain-containing protein [Deltaproteobacteria bacterium]